MTKRSTLSMVSGAVGAVLIVAMTAGSAAALSASANKCRQSVGKAYGKLVKTTGKTLAKCHKLRDAGKITNVADCNDIAGDLADIDPAGKIAKAQGKLVDSIAKSCVYETSLLGTDYYTSCPEPCATQLGITDNPMTTFGQVADCLACVGPATIASLYENTMGAPTAPMASKDDFKCHGTIVKGYQKYLDTLLKGRQSCQTAEDKVGNDFLTTCETSDPKDKGAKALEKADGKIDKLCAAATLTNLDSCASDNLTNLKACLGSDYGDAAATAFTNSYELTPTICPSAIQTIVRAGCSTDAGLTADPSQCLKGAPTDSTLSVGWSGYGHGIDVPDHYSITGAVTCPGSEAGSCGTCTIDGVSDLDPQYEAFSRCQQDPSIPCSPPFADNPACPSGGKCTYFLGPPLAVSTAGAFTCSLNTLHSDVDGIVAPDVGGSIMNLDLRTIVFTGESQVQPCPICIGDATPQDGVKSGHCLGGVKDVSTNPSWTCDVQGFDLNFSGPPDYDPAHDGVSLDCPPNQPSNISGTGLVINLPLSTGSGSLAFSNDCEAPYDSNKCACGQCTNDITLPCRDDSDCNLGTCTGPLRCSNDGDKTCTDNTDCDGTATCGTTCADDPGAQCTVDAECQTGTCTTNGGGAASVRKPNGCASFTCQDVGATDRGQCGVATQLDVFCDGLLRANGKGVLNCLDDNTCRSLDPACPGGGAGACGNCQHYQIRSCYLDPIAVEGTPDVHNPVLAGTFCLPPTENVSINQTTGSPGAGEVKIDTLVHKFY